MTGIYLMFNGNCKEALQVYEKAFDTKTTELQRYGDMPASENFPVSEEQKNLVMYAKFNLEATEILCADSSEYTVHGDNMYISLSTKNEALVKRAWTFLKEEAHVYMELQPTFFSSVHGSLRDKFGVSWMFTVDG